MYEDDPKVIDITTYSSQPEIDTPITYELHQRSRLRRKARLQRMKNDNYFFAMINLLLITQSILIIGFIFIISKLY